MTLHEAFAKPETQAIRPELFTDSKVPLSHGAIPIAPRLFADLAILAEFGGGDLE